MQELFGEEKTNEFIHHTLNFVSQTKLQLSTLFQSIQAYFSKSKQVVRKNRRQMNSLDRGTDHVAIEVTSRIRALFPFLLEHFQDAVLVGILTAVFLYLLQLRNRRRRQVFR